MILDWDKLLKDVLMHHYETKLTYLIKFYLIIEYLFLYLWSI